MIGCFVSSSVFLVDGGVVVLKCGMDVDLCWYRYAIMHSSRLNWRSHDVGLWNV